MFVLVSIGIVPAWAHAIKVKCVITTIKTFIITTFITSSTNTITNTSFMSQTQCPRHKASTEHKCKSAVGMLVYWLGLYVTRATGTYD